MTLEIIRMHADVMFLPSALYAVRLIDPQHALQFYYFSSDIMSHNER